MQGVELVAADALKPETLAAAVAGIDVAWYLVHSMAAGKDFGRLDLEAADVVTLDRSGRATVPLDIPDFNGRLRLMAVAWSDTALGHDEEGVVVRDPVVAELTLPRFLAPGDEALATLTVDNVEGPAGAKRQQ